MSDHALDRAPFAGALLATALTVLSSAAAAQTAAATQASPEHGETRRLIDAILDADAGTRRAELKKTQWSNSTVVTQLLDAARREKDTKRSVRIIQLVGELGIGADAAWPLLVAIMEDQDRGQLEIGKAIREPKTRPGPVAAIALGQLAPYVQDDREAVVQALQSELRNQHGFHIADVRRAYFRALVAAGGEQPELVRQLEDDNPYVRETAAEALGSLGGKARAAVAGLVEALNTEHPQKITVKFGGWSGSSSANWNEKIHAAAARALVQIAPADKRAFAAHLFVARNEKDPELLITSLRHVGFMNKDGEPALERLCKLLEHANSGVAAEAVTAIGMIGIRNEAVLEALEIATKREEKAVAARAKATLRMLDRK